MTRHPSKGGFTLPELMIVVALMGVLASMAVPSTQSWFDDQDARAMSRSIANAFHTARQQSLRTGRNHVVFLSVAGAGDTVGNPLLGPSGNAVPILVLDDGVSGSVNQNCQIDPGETTYAIRGASGLSWGFSLSAGNKAPGDLTAAPTAAGSSFQTPAGVATTWVMFGPDGMPIAFDAGCNPGQIGSANGAVYLTNGRVDYSIVLSALGATKVHAWDAMASQWRS